MIADGYIESIREARENMRKILPDGCGCYAFFRAGTAHCFYVGSSEYLMSRVMSHVTGCTKTPKFTIHDVLEEVDLSVAWWTVGTAAGAKKQERRFFDDLNPALNTHRPLNAQKFKNSVQVSYFLQEKTVRKLRAYAKKHRMKACDILNMALADYVCIHTKK